MKRGIVGLGDSFMWGESLYFYSGYADLPFKPNHSYNSNEMRESFLQFKNKHRYITKVGNYLDTWSLTSKFNGSNNITALNEHFKDEFINNGKLLYDDIGLIIYQFTGPERINVPIEKQFEIILENVDIWKSHGIQYYFLSWLDIYKHHPMYEKYFMDKHIWIDTPDGDSIFGWYELTDNDTSDLTVHYDFSPNGYQNGDIHLNIKGHDMVANSIINRLKNDNFKI